MQRLTPRKMMLSLGLAGAVLALSACDPEAVSTGGSVYYDSMLWNDYYYGRPPGYRPPGGRPPRPEHPIERPPRPTPLPARPPIHRPSPRL